MFASQAKHALKSKKYEFVVDGTMPVLEFEIKGGTEREHLHIELYNPMVNEIFEAKFAKGRIEVDKDGSITHFTTSTDHVNFSLFLGHNLQISMEKSEVLIRSPSKIVSVEQDLKSKEHSEEVTSDSIRLKLE
jgi:hypothetical protein